MPTRTHRDGHAYARAIELGNEPPLRFDGDAALQSRQVNLRWLAGTILTGAAGFALMSAAIYTSMNGEMRLAQAPGAAQARPIDNLAAGLRSNASPRKGDLMSAQRPAEEEKQTFRISTVTSAGEREVVRTRSVTRITASLATSGPKADVPPFNPMAIFVDNDAPSADNGPPPDGDISYVVRDLSEIEIAADEGMTVPLERVLSRVRDTAAIESAHLGDFTGTGEQGFAAPSMQAELASLGQVALPNMTVIAKRPASETADGGGDERVVTTSGSERLEDILTANGATPDEARAIAAAFGAPQGYGTIGLTAGQTVRILLDRTGARAQPVRVILESRSGEAIVALSDTGGYVAVAEAPEIADEGETEVETATGSTLRLYESLYATALAKGTPKPVIEELVRVFGNDADFQRRVADGDGFEVLFASDEDGDVDGAPEILYSSLISGGETRRYYRFQMPGDGGVDYFDESGRSARKFLLRKPMASGIMRSGYGLRRHPILGYSKMHTGVDWAAPRGTPIYAAGNGTIAHAARKGGYGNQVMINHSNGYETAYSHMTGFARGLKTGDRVRQGQLIGYVGSTGLSTGPHLHYEVLVNGRFVNPMRIKVPRGNELSGEALAKFQAERSRIDNIVNRGTAQTQQIATESRGG